MESQTSSTQTNNLATNIRFTSEGYTSSINTLNKESTEKVTSNLKEALTTTFKISNENTKKSSEETEYYDELTARSTAKKHFTHHNLDEDMEDINPKIMQQTMPHPSTTSKNEINTTTVSESTEIFKFATKSKSLTFHNPQNSLDEDMEVTILTEEFSEFKTISEPLSKQEHNTKIVQNDKIPPSTKSSFESSQLESISSVKKFSTTETLKTTAEVAGDMLIEDKELKRSSLPNIIKANNDATMKHKQISTTKYSEEFKTSEDFEETEMAHFSIYETSTLCEKCDEETDNSKKPLEDTKSEIIQTTLKSIPTKKNKLKSSTKSLNEFKTTEGFEETEMAHFSLYETSTLCEKCDEETKSSKEPLENKNSEIIQTSIKSIPTKKNKLKSSTKYLNEFKTTEEFEETEMAHFSLYETSTLCEKCDEETKSSKESLENTNSEIIQTSVKSIATKKNKLKSTTKYLNEFKTTEEFEETEMAHFSIQETSTLCETCEEKGQNITIKQSSGMTSFEDNLLKEEVSSTTVEASSLEENSNIQNNYKLSSLVENHEETLTTEISNKFSPEITIQSEMSFFNLNETTSSISELSELSTVTNSNIEETTNTYQISQENISENKPNIFSDATSISTLINIMESSSIFEISDILGKTNKEENESQTIIESTHATLEENTNIRTAQDNRSTEKASTEQSSTMIQALTSTVFIENTEETVLNNFNITVSSYEDINDKTASSTDYTKTTVLEVTSTSPIEQLTNAEETVLFNFNQTFSSYENGNQKSSSITEHSKITSAEKSSSSPVGNFTNIEETVLNNFNKTVSSYEEADHTTSSSIEYSEYENASSTFMEHLTNTEERMLTDFNEIFSSNNNVNYETSSSTEYSKLTPFEETSSSFIEYSITTEQTVLSNFNQTFSSYENGNQKSSSITEHSKITSAEKTSSSPVGNFTNIEETVLNKFNKTVSSYEEEDHTTSSSIEYSEYENASSTFMEHLTNTEERVLTDFNEIFSSNHDVNYGTSSSTEYSKLTPFEETSSAFIEYSITTEETVLSDFNNTVSLYEEQSEKTSSATEVSILSPNEDTISSFLSTEETVFNNMNKTVFTYEDENQKTSTKIEHSKITPGVASSTFIGTFTNVEETILNKFYTTSSFEDENYKTAISSEYSKLTSLEKAPSSLAEYFTNTEETMITNFNNTISSSEEESDKKSSSKEYWKLTSSGYTSSTSVEQLTIIEETVLNNFNQTVSSYEDDQLTSISTGYSKSTSFEDTSNTFDENFTINEETVSNNLIKTISSFEYQSPETSSNNEHTEVISGNDSSTYFGHFTNAEATVTTVNTTVSSFEDGSNKSSSSSSFSDAESTFVEHLANTETVSSNEEQIIKTTSSAEYLNLNPFGEAASTFIEQPTNTEETVSNKTVSSAEYSQLNPFGDDFTIFDQHPETTLTKETLYTAETTEIISSQVYEPYNFTTETTMVKETFSLPEKNDHFTAFVSEESETKMKESTYSNNKYTDTISTESEEKEKESSKNEETGLIGGDIKEDAKHKTTVPHKHTKATSIHNGPSTEVLEVTDLGHFSRHETSTLCEICDENAITPHASKATRKEEVTHHKNKATASTIQNISASTQEIVEETGLGRFSIHESSTLCETCEETSKQSVFSSYLTLQSFFPSTTSFNEIAITKPEIKLTTLNVEESVISETTEKAVITTQESTDTIDFENQILTNFDFEITTTKSEISEIETKSTETEISYYQSTTEKIIAALTKAASTISESWESVITKSSILLETLITSESFVTEISKETTKMSEESHMLLSEEAKSTKEAASISSEASEVSMSPKAETQQSTQTETQTSKVLAEGTEMFKTLQTEETETVTVVSTFSKEIVSETEATSITSEKPEAFNMETTISFVISSTKLENTEASATVTESLKGEEITKGSETAETTTSKMSESIETEIIISSEISSTPVETESFKVSTKETETLHTLTTEETVTSEMINEHKLSENTQTTITTFKASTVQSKVFPESSNELVHTESTENLSTSIKENQSETAETSTSLLEALESLKTESVSVHVTSSLPTETETTKVSSKETEVSHTLQTELNEVLSTSSQNSIFETVQTESTTFEGLESSKEIESSSTSTATEVSKEPIKETETTQTLPTQESHEATSALPELLKSSKTENTISLETSSATAETETHIKEVEASSTLAEKIKTASTVMTSSFSEETETQKTEVKLSQTSKPGSRSTETISTTELASEISEISKDFETTLTETTFSEVITKATFIAEGLINDNSTATHEILQFPKSTISISNISQEGTTEEYPATTLEHASSKSNTKVYNITKNQKGSTSNTDGSEQSTRLVEIEESVIFSLVPETTLNASLNTQESSTEITTSSRNILEERTKITSSHTTEITSESFQTELHKTSSEMSSSTSESLQHSEILSSSKAGTTEKASSIKKITFLTTTFIYPSEVETGLELTRGESTTHLEKSSEALSSLQTTHSTSLLEKESDENSDEETTSVTYSTTKSIESIEEHLKSLASTSETFLTQSAVHAINSEYTTTSINTQSEVEEHSETGTVKISISFEETFPNHEESSTQIHTSESEKHPKINEKTTTLFLEKIFSELSSETTHKENTENTEEQKSLKPQKTSTLNYGSSALTEIEESTSKKANQTLQSSENQTTETITTLNQDTAENAHKTEEGSSAISETTTVSVVSESKTKESQQEIISSSYSTESTSNGFSMSEKISSSKMESESVIEETTTLSYSTVTPEPSQSSELSSEESVNTSHFHEESSSQTTSSTHHSSTNHEANITLQQSTVEETAETEETIKVTFTETDKTATSKKMSSAHSEHYSSSKLSTFEAETHHISDIVAFTTDNILTSESETLLKETTTLSYGTVTAEVTTTPETSLDLNMKTKNILGQGTTTENDEMQQQSEATTEETITLNPTLFVNTTKSVETTQSTFENILETEESSTVTAMTENINEETQESKPAEESFSTEFSINQITFSESKEALSFSSEEEGHTKSEINEETEESTLNQFTIFNNETTENISEETTIEEISIKVPEEENIFKLSTETKNDETSETTIFTPFSLNTNFNGAEGSTTAAYEGQIEGYSKTTKSNETTESLEEGLTTSILTEIPNNSHKNTKTTSEEFSGLEFTSHVRVLLTESSSAETISEESSTSEKNIKEGSTSRKNNEDSSTSERNNEESSTSERNNEESSTSERHNEERSTSEKSNEESSTSERNNEESSLSEISNETATAESNETGGNPEKSNEESFQVITFKKNTTESIQDFSLLLDEDYNMFPLNASKTNKETSTQIFEDMLGNVDNFTVSSELLKTVSANVNLETSNEETEWTTFEELGETSQIITNKNIETVSQSVGYTTSQFVAEENQSERRSTIETQTVKTTVIINKEGTVTNLENLKTSSDTNKPSTTIRSTTSAASTQIEETSTKKKKVMATKHTTEDEDMELSSKSTSEIIKSEKPEHSTTNSEGNVTELTTLEDYEQEETVNKASTKTKSFTHYKENEDMNSSSEGFSQLPSEYATENKHDHSKALFTTNREENEDMETTHSVPPNIKTFAHKSKITPATQEESTSEYDATKTEDEYTKQHHGLSTHLSTTEDNEAASTLHVSSIATPEMLDYEEENTGQISTQASSETSIEHTKEYSERLTKESTEESSLKSTQKHSEEEYPEDNVEESTERNQTAEVATKHNEDNLEKTSKIPTRDHLTEHTLKVTNELTTEYPEEHTGKEEHATNTDHTEENHKKQTRKYTQEHTEKHTVKPAAKHTQEETAKSEEKTEKYSKSSVHPHRPSSTNTTYIDEEEEISTKCSEINRLSQKPEEKTIMLTLTEGTVTFVNEDHGSKHAKNKVATTTNDFTVDIESEGQSSVFAQNNQESLTEMTAPTEQNSQLTHKKHQHQTQSIWDVTEQKKTSTNDDYADNEEEAAQINYTPTVYVKTESTTPEPEETIKTTTKLTTCKTTVTEEDLTITDVFHPMAVSDFDSITEFPETTKFLDRFNLQNTKQPPSSTRILVISAPTEAHNQKNHPPSNKYSSGETTVLSMQGKPLTTISVNQKQTSIPSIENLRTLSTFHEENATTERNEKERLTTESENESSKRVFIENIQNNVLDSKISTAIQSVTSNSTEENMEDEDKTVEEQDTTDEENLKSSQSGGVSHETVFWGKTTTHVSEEEASSESTTTEKARENEDTGISIEEPTNPLKSTTENPESKTTEVITSTHEGTKVNGTTKLDVEVTTIAQNIEETTALKLSLPKNFFQNKCNITNYNEKDPCICNPDSLIRDINKIFKQNNTDIMEDLESLTCSGFIKITEGIYLKMDNPPPSRHKRSYDFFMGEFERLKKRMAIPGQNIVKALNEGIDFQNTESKMYALPGNQVSIPCLGGNEIVDYGRPKYSWEHAGHKIVEGQIESDGTLVLQNATPEDGGNYSCLMSSLSDNPEVEAESRKFDHELIILSLPLYSINTHILYNMSEKCELHHTDLMSSYLPYTMTDAICGLQTKICAVEVHTPHCISKEGQSFLSLSVKAKMTSVESIFPSINSTQCNVNCKMKIMAKLTMATVKNIEIIERISNYRRDQFLAQLKRYKRKSKIIQMSQPFLNCWSLVVLALVCRNVQKFAWPVVRTLTVLEMNRIVSRVLLDNTNLLSGQKPAFSALPHFKTQHVSESCIQIRKHFVIMSAGHLLA